MSKIYAVIGTSQQTIIADSIRYTPSENEILMKFERPEGDYIANENGEWVKDISKEIEALDNQYNSEMARIGNEYNSAQLHGDTDTMTALQEEVANLDEWYDSEYEKIVGGAD